MIYTHHVSADVDECKGLAGQDNEVEPSSASNRLVSQRCFCTGTKHILQMHVTHFFFFFKPFVHLNSPQLLFYLSILKAKTANCDEDYRYQEINSSLMQA